MRKVYLPTHALHAPPSEHPESPWRVDFLVEKFGLEPIDPEGTEKPLKIHDSEYLECLKAPQWLDPDTYVSPLSWMVVKKNAAILELLAKEKKGFFAVRPPGHHAGPDYGMGSCLVNNAAILASLLSERTAILDLDFHHGNGTEHFVREGIIEALYVSLHGSPAYPGTGLESGSLWKNFPLPPETDGETYLSILQKALEEIRTYEPEVLIVSLGFDTHEKDLLGFFRLSDEHFRRIASLLKPFENKIFLLEGGYSREGLSCARFFLC